MPVLVFQKKAAKKGSATGRAAALRAFKMYIRCNSIYSQFTHLTCSNLPHSAAKRLGARAGKAVKKL